MNGPIFIGRGKRPRWLVLAVSSLLAVPLLTTGGVARADGSTVSAPFTQCPRVNYSPSCEILLVVNPDRTVTVLHDGNVGPYDGGDDTLVGIVNNSTAAVPAVTVTGQGTDLSGFDYDGLCAYGVSGCPLGPTGYEGPGTNFVTAASQPDSAEVDFADLQPGQSGYFSLEGDLQFAQLTARQGHLTGDVRYVALGDSYSSGEGNPPFFAGTDQSGDYCHRSPQAYSQVLGSAYGASPMFYACSGAVTNNVLSSTQYPGEGTFQLNRPGVDATANLVTMTIGGNDAGFGDVVQSCILQKVKSDAITSTTPGAIADWLGYGPDPSCAHSQSFVSSANARVQAAGTAAQNAYATLLGTVDPTNTSVLVADYPHLFPDSDAEKSCIQLSPYLTKDDQTFMNNAADLLDANLRQAAGNAGVNFVEARDTFGGHAICANNGAYLNALSIASGNGGSCTASVLGQCVISGAPIVGSFHPNSAGQASGYAVAFQNYIANATSVTSAGFPSNPGPSYGPHALATASNSSSTTSTSSAHSSSTSTSPAADVQLADLTAQPVTSGSADCSGTYQAGQLVHFSGSGYKPGTTVTVYASSPGLGNTDEQLLAKLAADKTGTVSGTVRIPLAATGFTPNGAKAGFIGLDALGTGAATSHLDDLVLVGLAGHDSPCGTVEDLGFQGFTAPVSNSPAVNRTNAGDAVPLKFTLPGIAAPLSSVLAAGYPQSTAVACDATRDSTSGDPATTNANNGAGSSNDSYDYVWKTDSSWRGCRDVIVKLVDGLSHTARFDFGS